MLGIGFGCADPGDLGQGVVFASRAELVEDRAADRGVGSGHGPLIQRAGWFCIAVLIEVEQ